MTLQSIVFRMIRQNAEYEQLVMPFKVIGFNTDHEYRLLSDTFINQGMVDWLKENVGEYYAEWSYRRNEKEQKFEYGFADEKKMLHFKLTFDV